MMKEDIITIVNSIAVLFFFFGVVVKLFDYLLIIFINNYTDKENLVINYSDDSDCDNISDSTSDSTDNNSNNNNTEEEEEEKPLQKELDIIDKYNIDLKKSIDIILSDNTEYFVDKKCMKSIKNSINKHINEYFKTEKFLIKAGYYEYEYTGVDEN